MKNGKRFGWTFLDSFCFCLLLSLCILALVLGGCDGQSAKQSDALKQIKKSQEDLEQQMKVQGEGNQLMFQKINKSVETTVQNTNKISQQMDDSASITAKKIGELSQKWEANTNSTFLMICLFGMMLLTLGGMLFFIIKHLLLGAKIKRAIVSSGNDLDIEKFKKI